MLLIFCTNALYSPSPDSIPTVLDSKVAAKLSSCLILKTFHLLVLKRYLAVVKQGEHEKGELTLSLPESESGDAGRHTETDEERSVLCPPTGGPGGQSMLLCSAGRAGLSPQLLTNFYMATIESILCLSAAVWYDSCTAQDRKDLARVVKTAQGIVGSSLPDLDSIYAGRMIQKKAQHIAADPTHPGNGLFVPLPSGKWYRNIKTTTSRLKNSFDNK
ncbi:hypothetical protein L3Q82_021866 [Scortum barcoo]|uniref:Uncharacterized protein n=1 Tax=Scortum barcoo TaxID=214431 RepID=A0ACB8X906_9TELE|nr:hypothetical protein L3Q82_021866 [Scortum barcoo]